MKWWRLDLDKNFRRDDIFLLSEKKNLHMFVVLKVSSLIKKGLSSNCRAILLWKLALALRKSLRKYWRFVLEFTVNIYTAPSCAKATMTIIHGRQTHAIQTIILHLTKGKLWSSWFLLKYSWNNQFGKLNADYHAILLPLKENNSRPLRNWHYIVVL